MPGKPEQLAEEARLAPERTDEMPAPLIYPDLDTAVRTQMPSGLARRAIEHAGEPATRKALATAFVDSQPDGSYRQHNSFRYLIARA